MYTATMRYQFIDGKFEEGCALWRELVLDEARKAPGLVRMQFLVSRPAALAIGTWQDKTYAEAFMRTGVFKRLMERIRGSLAADPSPEQWSLDSIIP
jgi:hypothetical protein